MAQYFETRATFDCTLESGVVKTVTEAFLVGAESFAEAEKGLILELKPYMKGPFAVKAVKRTKISEVVNPCVGKYWLAKVANIIIDEETGAKMRSICEMLVGGGDFNEAYNIIVDHMKGTIVDYDLVSLSETQILDAFCVWERILFSDIPKQRVKADRLFPASEGTNTHK